MRAYLNIQYSVRTFESRPSMRVFRLIRFSFYHPIKLHIYAYTAPDKVNTQSLSSPGANFVAEIFSLSTVGGLPYGRRAPLCAQKGARPFENCQRLVKKRNNCSNNCSIIQMAVSTSTTCSIRTMYPWHRINCGDIVIGNEIGSGSFGSVYEAVCFGRVRVAAKKVSLQFNRFVNL